MFEDYYALNARPFQLTPDPAYYFLSKTHRKAQSYLNYGVAQAEGLVVLTGEPGCGKTAVVVDLLARLDPKTCNAARIVSSALDAGGLVQAVAHAYKLGSYDEDKAAALSNIRLFLEEEAVAGRRCLLIVDDAQNLSDDALEELRMLLNYQLLNHPLLQAVLLGDGSLRHVLSTQEHLEPLRQRIIASYHLGALEAEEVGDYIQHRLVAAGYRGKPEFAPGAFGAVYTASFGNPRKINHIMTRLLLLGAVEDRAALGQEDVETVVAELVASETFLAGYAGEESESTPRNTDPSSAEPPAYGMMLDELLFQQNAHAGLLEARDAEIAALGARIAQLEDGLSGQESALRHTVTKVIQLVEAPLSEARMTAVG